MEIRLTGITKRFAALTALDSVSLAAGSGELLALLGPSGCGKTTLLRILAGFIPQDSGTIEFGSDEVSSWPARKRNAAMVFQNYALFPHLSVRKNIAFGLSARHVPNREIGERVNAMLEKVDLAEYGERKIQELSGGQRQRVALARALVVEPNALLFDEPLSNLDERLRKTMRAEIRRIQKESGITAIYVTHDQEEAMSIADRIVVMDKGKVQQIVVPEALYREPANAFVARFMGHENIFELPVADHDGGSPAVELLGKTIRITRNVSSEKSVTVLLRPEELFPDRNGFPAKVLSHEHRGALLRYTLSAEDRVLRMDTLCRKNTKVHAKGEIIRIGFDPDALHVFSGAGVAKRGKEDTVDH